MHDVAAVTCALTRGLNGLADPRTREHWERYLKGAAQFRGVPMAGVRATVRQVWREHRLAGCRAESLFELADEWFASQYTEDKLAATLLLAEQMPERLRLSHVPALAGPLERGHVADWNICDWYATKALHAFLTADPGELSARAEEIAEWSAAPSLWQRRAAVVAFVKLAAEPSPFPGFVELLLRACEGNLVSDDRFAHTGPGWLLRELSRQRPEAVTAFVEDHPGLSPEARRMATARLRQGPYRRR